MISTFSHIGANSNSGFSTVCSVDLRGPAGRLEAILNGGADDAPFAALVCHPHPRAGGTMHNKVVYHATKVLNDREWGLGWPVLRFNFRGAGLSGGRHDGAAETGDVAAALDWLENEYSRPIFVAGFSFGAAISLRACFDRSRPVGAIAALGLPLAAEGLVYDYSFLAEFSTPKLFLSGDNDTFAPAAQLAEVAGAAAEPKRLVIVPRADHFFNGELEQMQRELAGWIKELQ